MKSKAKEFAHYEAQIAAMLAGDRRALAKLITLIESTLEQDRKQANQVVAAIMPHSGKSIRIGISGIPGVGKSTFIEAFGLHLTQLGKKCAVLAVDPSSAKTGGSILADKTRMETLSRQAGVYIRPSPANGSLGGVANATRETILLCEAAGFDVVIVETVGVGQSEYQVATMVDFFMLLALPNAGDEIQGIKRGILEWVDTIVVNKADGEQKSAAKRAEAQYRQAFQLLGLAGLANSKDLWVPKVVSCSALSGENIPKIWLLIEEFVVQYKLVWQSRRQHQLKQWMWQLVQDLLMQQLCNSRRQQRWWQKIEQDLALGHISPHQAAEKVLLRLRQ